MENVLICLSTVLERVFLLRDMVWDTEISLHNGNYLYSWAEIICLSFRYVTQSTTGVIYTEKAIHEWTNIVHVWTKKYKNNDVIEYFMGSFLKTTGLKLDIISDEVSISEFFKSLKTRWSLTTRLSPILLLAGYKNVKQLFHNTKLSIVNILKEEIKSFYKSHLASFSLIYTRIL